MSESTRAYERWTYAKAAVWSGVAFLAIDAASQLVVYPCHHYLVASGSFYCAALEEFAFAIDRLRFVTHPLANRLFNAYVVALGEPRFMHVWTPTTLEAIRDAVLFFGLNLLESFLYGALIGVIIKSLCLWFSKVASISKN